MSASPEPAVILGTRVTHSAPLRWGFAHHTEVVTLEDGRRVVAKRFDGPDGAAELRRSVALTDRLQGAGIPTPAVLSADPESDPPLLVLAFTEGTTGAEWLDTSARAQTLAETMGSLAGRFRDLAVDPGEVASGTWAGSSRLASAATGWLSAIAPKIAPHAGQRRMLDEIRDVIATLPDFYDATEPRLAHGDFVPVNVLLAADGSLAGVLDLGSWRIAHPWLDVAWWGVVVATFHRDTWVTAWPSLLSSSGVPGERSAAATIRALQVLRSLESAATRNDPAALRLLGTAVAQQIEP